MRTARKIVIFAAILTLFLGAFSTLVSAQITEIVSDPEDDVIIISEDVFGGDTGEDFVLEKTADKPNIDITKLTYIREEGSTQVTVKLEVNSRGIIEDRNDFEDVDPDDLTFTGSIVTYGLSLETSENFYEIEYMAGNCTLNYGEINATVIGNVLSITFNLDDISETFVALIGTTMQFDINSLTDIKYYMDIAPDSALFTAYPSASPTTAKTGESINFAGEYDDSFGISVAPYTYTWTFDDGTTSNEQSPTHSYHSPGTYFVRLKVEDSQGLSSEGTIQLTITTGQSSNGGNTNGGSNDDTDDGAGLLLFIVVIAIIVIIGVVALVFVIRR